MTEQKQLSPFTVLALLYGRISGCLFSFLLEVEWVNQSFLTSLKRRTNSVLMMRTNTMYELVKIGETPEPNLSYTCNLLENWWVTLFKV